MNKITEFVGNVEKGFWMFKHKASVDVAVYSHNGRFVKCIDGKIKSKCHAPMDWTRFDCFGKLVMTHWILDSARKKGDNGVLLTFRNKYGNEVMTKTL